jgi:dihydrofolate reductase
VPDEHLSISDRSQRPDRRKALYGELSASTASSRPLEMGETTFTFVTDGIRSALAHAREAAGDHLVSIAGGAQTVQQYLAAGLIDELQLHIVPVLLGAGERLFEDVGDLQLHPLEVQGSPAVTHIRYRVGAGQR